MFCPACSQQLPEGTKVCPHCGERTDVPVASSASTPLPPPVPQQLPRMRKKVWIIGGVLLFLVVVILISSGKMKLDDFITIATLSAGAAFFYFRRRRKQAALAAMTPAERETHLANIQTAKQGKKLRRQAGWNVLMHGIPKPEFICPHCQVKGKVHTRAVKRKKGVSGGKATAAVLTLGFSLLATGLSRKESETEAWCGNCQTSWML